MGFCERPDPCPAPLLRVRTQVIAEVSSGARRRRGLRRRKLHALRREEELIHEEAKEAAAYLKAELPVIVPGQVGCHASSFGHFTDHCSQNSISF